jgi:hypothetical protein
MSFILQLLPTITFLFQGTGWYVYPYLSLSIHDTHYCSHLFLTTFDSTFLRVINSFLFLATMRHSTSACVLLVLAASPALAAPVIAFKRDDPAWMEYWNNGIFPTRIGVGALGPFRRNLPKREETTTMTVPPDRTVTPDVHGLLLEPVTEGSLGWEYPYSHWWPSGYTNPYLGIGPAVHPSAKARDGTTDHNNTDAWEKYLTKLLTTRDSDILSEVFDRASEVQERDPVKDFWRIVLTSRSAVNPTPILDREVPAAWANLIEAVKRDSNNLFDRNTTVT